MMRIRSIDNALPRRASSSSNTAQKTEGPEATSKRRGIPVRNFSIANSFFTPIHGMERTGHPNIRQIRGPLRENLIIGRLHMRMGTDHGDDLSVQICPIAIFSDVASACMSTITATVRFFSAANSFLATWNGQSKVGMYARPISWRTPSCSPPADSTTTLP